MFFSHGTNHSKCVCILINSSFQYQVEHSYSDNSGRIVLITIILDNLKLSLCNIYAPNNQTNQLEFIQELNNCIIDKTEMSALIIGGDWNCTLSKKDKLGGSTWVPTNYSKLVLTSMDIFDLIDIYRVSYANLRKFTYESKALKMKSRIDFFLVAKSLTKSVKKIGIYPSIAPDHQASYILLSWRCETPRGPGLWKFNNTLLQDEQYVAKVRETYAKTLNYFGSLSDKQLLWEMIKMEIRSTTISFTKHKAKLSSDRLLEIRCELDQLDDIICNNFFFSKYYPNFATLQ